MVRKSTNEDVYYQLQPASCVASASVDAGWLHAANQTVLCEGCGNPIDRAIGIDVKVSDAIVSCAYNTIRKIAIDYMSVEFARFIGLSTLRKTFVFGTITDSRCESLVEYISMFPRNPVLVRGSSRSYWERCRLCGQIFYLPDGQVYLVRDSLPEAPVFGDQLKAIVVRADYFESLCWRHWKKYVKVYTVRVRDKAVDGMML